MSVEKLDEKSIQEFISEFPWLLNINYESVPELKKKGMEHIISDQKRIDLILRDSITNRPIIIEFKAVKFNRQDVGQILEYRSKVLMELSNPDSKLRDIFGNLIASPILILVVPSCDEYARISCNLNGIEIFEYEKAQKTFLNPSKLLSFKETFSNFAKKNILPVDTERHVSIKNLNNEIFGVMEDLRYSDYFKKNSKPKGHFFYSLANFFINIGLFNDSIVSIGIYEDIFNNKYNDVCFAFYSGDEEKFDKFISSLKKRNKSKYNSKKEIDKNSNSDFYYPFYFNKKEFLENPAIIKDYIKDYVSIMEKEFNTKFEKDE